MTNPCEALGYRSRPHLPDSHLLVDTVSNVGTYMLVSPIRWNGAGDPRGASAMSETTNVYQPQERNGEPSTI